MSQTTHRHLVAWNDSETSFGDGSGSGPLFSIYSNAADDEGNKTVERRQGMPTGSSFSLLVLVSTFCRVLV
ncbi:hypothetical protein DFH94DRAFT_699003 [Russula ochroleuca]|uniref:Uncharacterized protein n=1 Tax=Russula ochroleuca TaxID=152965 RepID=A0A9P5JUB1_9AGAM|nr:hypothetical protein DFH94DRAFT_699003 [Russula ochroleuca]